MLKEYIEKEKAKTPKKLLGMIEKTRKFSLECFKTMYETKKEDSSK